MTVLLMDAHPSFTAIEPLLSSYPATALSFYQAYNDLLYAQQWTDIVVLDVPAANRGAILGKKPGEEAARVVVPCELTESLSPSWLTAVFANITPSPSEIYLAIVASDSSLVYYRLSKGIVKPPM